MAIVDVLKKYGSGPAADTAQEIIDMDLSQTKTISHKIAIILMHHLRKTRASDEFDPVSGSTGLTGAADTIARLNRKRLRTVATLLISGRIQVAELDALIAKRVAEIQKQIEYLCSENFK